MVICNDRDLSILEFLREQGWALSSQIAQLFFNSNQTLCLRRLRKLESGSLIEGKDLSSFKKEYWHDNPLFRDYMQVMPKTKVFRLGRTIRSSIGKRWRRMSSDKMVMHQALLTHVQWALETKLGEIEFRSEAAEAMKLGLAWDNSGEQEPYPDLAFTNDNLKICLELERKPRRGMGRFNSAYDKRIERFSANYDRVLYVTEKEDYLSAFIERGDGIRNVGFMSFFDLSTVYRQGYESINIKDFLASGYGK